MALEMRRTDVGYSSSGMNKLTDELKKAYNGVSQAADVQSVNFLKLTSVLRENWRGDDCNNFIKDLEKASKNLKISIDETHKKVTQSLNVYKQNIDSLQKNTYKANSVNIK